MTIKSIDFLICLILAVGLYWVIPDRFKWKYLLLLSLMFYASVKVEYLFLMLAFVLIDYFISIRFCLVKHKSSQTKRLLWLCIIINILGLLAFKYLSFLGNFLSLVFGELPIFIKTRDLQIIIPLGISFFVFKKISYVVDVYRGVLPVEKNFGKLALYFLFFPSITAGPINKAKDFLGQINEPKIMDYGQISDGVALIVLGFFKKVVIADRISLYVSAVRDNMVYHSALTVVFSTFLFAIQIYCDFSAYSDIAIGCAKLFGFELPENFRRPYFAKTMSEFWRRWHISLSEWLRDYIFLPLSFSLNRRLKQEAYFFVKSEMIIYFLATMTTMLACGLWHGPKMTFVFWGALLGFFLVMEHLIRKVRRRVRKLLRHRKGIFTFISVFVVFICINIAWFFFNTTSLQQAFTVITHLSAHSGFYYGETESLLYITLFLLVLLVTEFKEEYRSSKRHFSVDMNALYYGFLFVCILLFGVFDQGQFIYEKF